jgi:hypothetical protein
MVSSQVAYGDGMADRIRLAPSKVDAFIDTFGADYVQLALGLGVEPSRIETVVNFEAVARYGSTPRAAQPVFAGPCAEPSWNHDAAQTRFPRLLNSVSSIRTSTGSPSGTSSDTTSLAVRAPRSSGFQRAREKK